MMTNDIFQQAIQKFFQACPDAANAVINPFRGVVIQAEGVGLHNLVEVVLFNGMGEEIQRITLYREGPNKGQLVSGMVLDNITVRNEQ